MATALVQGLDGRTVLGRVWGTAGLCRYDIPLLDEKMNVWVYFERLYRYVGKWQFMDMR